MSITDSSTSLTTTWTEQSLVTFNAGMLSAVADCVSEVESKLRRGTLSNNTKPTRSEVERWLVRAKEELMELRRYTFSRRYAYVSTVAGTWRYALPPDFNGGDIALRDTSNNRLLEQWPDFMFDNKFPDPAAESRGEPELACIKNMEVWLIPPPDGVYTLELHYQRSGADNTKTEFGYLPEIERFRCCDKALSESFESLHMWEQASVYQAKWNEGLGRAKKADSKRRWSRMNFQAVSVLQQDLAHNNQRDKA